MKKRARRAKGTQLVIAALVVILAGGLVCTSSADAATYCVAPDGSDDNPGAEAKPFKTVQKALSQASAGDTVRIKAGTYDLAGFSKTVEQPLSLIGDDNNTTNLTNGGTLTFTSALTVQNLRFSDYKVTVFEAAPQKGQTIDGLVIENCTFEKLHAVIRTKKRITGTITNVRISKCRFRDMKSAGVVAIGITYGLISNVKITDNTFKNLTSTQKGCSAIVIGSNATRGTTKDVLISGNTMDKIIGPTLVKKGAGAEVHGILAYGTNVKILKNTVKDLNAGRDHEAIYTKASYSTIADNVIENCGSGGGGGDICSKGGKLSQGNVISGNRIFGDQPGRAILVNGGTTIKNNYIKKTTGFSGIDVYAYGAPVTITGNYIETKSGSGIRLDHGENAVITNNEIISYEGRTIALHSCTGTVLKGNKEHEGRP